MGIISGKGGVGKTTFATNLGIAMNNFGKKVLVIDCNFTAPHVAYYLGAGNTSVTLNDVMRKEIDVKFAPANKNGVMFIPCSDDVRDMMNLDPNELKHHVEKLAKEGSYDYIILDSAPGLGREALATMKSCDQIIFVTTPIIPNVMDVTRSAEVASELGHRDFEIVFNMARGKSFELKAENAAGVFGSPILGTIPFDEGIMDSTAQGVPYLWYQSKSKTANSFIQIAANLMGIKYQKPSRFGFLKRLFRR
jgi:MinD-like ATPase involved in chromosome partitioning or flagellar assembly